MKSKKILVYGYFGYENNQLDGQTVKTRSIFELLKQNVSKMDMSIDYFDTQTFKQSKLNLLRSWISISKCNVLFYLPAHNNLKYLFPFIFLICKIFKVDIHYVVVGGWLNDFLKSLPMHRRMLKSIKGIYPQTNDLVKLLQDNYSYTNVVKLHNFRFYKENVAIKKASDQIRLVFMARIHPQKGVNTLFELAEVIKASPHLSVSIDLYGPILDTYEAQFYSKLDKVDGLVNYRGVLVPENIVATLKEYDLFLFPTEYYTEGFPGSILEAYLAGVPVIASRWQYAAEFILEGETGFISEFKDSKDFIQKVLLVLEDESLLVSMKDSVKVHKHLYSPEEAWNILKNNL